MCQMSGSDEVSYRPGRPSRIRIQIHIRIRIDKTEAKVL